MKALILIIPVIILSLIACRVEAKPVIAVETVEVSTVQKVEVPVVETVIVEKTIEVPVVKTVLAGIEPSATSISIPSPTITLTPTPNIDSYLLNRGLDFDKIKEEMYKEWQIQRDSYLLESNPLLISKSIEKSAQDYAEFMATNLFYEHDSEKNLIKCGYCGENIMLIPLQNIKGKDEKEVAIFIINSWMNSTGHRQNMLRNDIKSGGLGISFTLTEPVSEYNNTGLASPKHGINLFGVMRMSGNSDKTMDTMKALPTPTPSPTASPFVLLKVPPIATEYLDPDSETFTDFCDDRVVGDCNIIFIHEHYLGKDYSTADAYVIPWRHSSHHMLNKKIDEHPRAVRDPAIKIFITLYLEYAMRSHGDDKFSILFSRLPSWEFRDVVKEYGWNYGNYEYPEKDIGGINSRIAPKLLVQKTHNILGLRKYQCRIVLDESNFTGFCPPQQEPLKILE